VAPLDDEERRAIRAEFRSAVNMTPSRLERWLDSATSKAVGQKRGGRGESTGHASGRRIVRLKRTRVADLTDDDHRHMRKVVGYIARHTEQRPEGDIRDTTWRHSLMNWGHDPARG
jgi:hypothetical protein